MQTQAKATPTNDTGGLGDLAFSDTGSLTLFPGDPSTDFPVSVSLKTRGRPVEIWIVGDISMAVGSSGGNSGATCRVKRNGTILGTLYTEGNVYLSSASAASSSKIPGVAIKLLDIDCPAGDNTFTFNFLPNISGTGSSFTVPTGSRILAKEL